MKYAIPFAAAFLASCTVSADRGMDRSAAAPGEVELSEAIAGRVPGEPRSCVRQQDVRNSRSAGDNTLLFDGPGGVVYVNRAGGSCPRIQPWHALRHQGIGTNLCSGELVRVFDPQTRIEYGGCSLGEFVPYRRTG